MKFFDCREWGKFSIYFDENGFLIKRGFWFGVSKLMTVSYMVISFWIIYHMRNDYSRWLPKVLFHDFCLLTLLLSSLHGASTGIWAMAIINFGSIVNYDYTFNNLRIILHTILFWIQLFTLTAFLLFIFFMTNNIWIVRYFK